MNRIQRERFRDRHLRQKYDLLHSLPTLQTPALAGLYLKSFYNATKRYDLTLPSEITDADVKFCGECGVVHVPMVNMDIVSTSDNEQEDSLSFKCRHCNHKVSFKSNKIESKINSPPPESLSNSPSPVIQNKISNSTAKSRAKKRKQNSLNSLLANKKKEQKNGSTSSLSSLTLESFMKR
ncbi:similar to Saccharomyces cerevisiae YDR478W SNM1 Subunit of RNase MRP, which cleaves pre-rRNA and has a role in cell cycle-regulated degradation of daughter cell-specific mRNAs [Maudiozyma barnettii]|uniref:Similar to Saccharomyces cerevisiae YDR478W SNM1 Subunit of RNase MRP, which cleaves pre-rRNA and has a role in cell cycle-regulated degradation of daughter cell-specific mRNAs n=1 Tax=Maudiozyma barnettii TaxID=61262 RepID=A0A8H2VHZ9_9SACH|nr:Snm1p [Kazachstania barnettii]CAB4256009.1 similar to Saccharomyces cerevisiae YDR478W SNM1 Subunit of RNase MRP, which cleaves pre-rRNA and has a role in cell cycle-regulated degradation of daughter cell-specific mRNAs [Kazachstania barnettii]CAD1784617.1 similar to Saccharomyces cerevisiae YDR478W SNM1 Subunit of RNase MRP, which cleaves pre-rRNA and has a role in cell cycle-regulated degradation of daughter cell-specific mRNAs [Kazachstania barnettii]